MIIENKIITNIEEFGKDGLNICDNEEWKIKNCIIDMSKYSNSEIDEAVGITYGSSAIFDHCIIKNASKLVLCGSGDKEAKELEKDKNVLFTYCLFENFGRRGPEVQSEMDVILDHCVVRNWNNPSYFNVRSFGAWAHHGGTLSISNSVFIQEKFMSSFSLFFKDLLNHIGQAWNDEKLFGLLQLESYLPGSCRGALATCGGAIEVLNCYKNKWWIYLENSKGSMNKFDANLLIAELETLYDTIGK